MCARMHRPDLVVCFVIVAALIFVLGAGDKSLAQSASVSPIVGIGTIRTGNSTLCTSSNLSRYSLIVAGAWNADCAGQQPGRSLTWGCAINQYNNDTQGDSDETRCGVPYSLAMANGWFLRDASGNLVHYGGCGTNEWLLDIGNPDYQQTFLTYIRRAFAAHPGIDGVWIDNVIGSNIAWCNTPTKYPTSASYRAAMLSFIKVVGGTLRSEGWYVGVNALMRDTDQESASFDYNRGDQDIWWDQQIAPYVDGIGTEVWQQLSSDTQVRTLGADWTQHWDGWERLPEAVRALGKDFIGFGGGSCSDGGAHADFLRASLMLDWSGDSSGTLLYNCGNQDYNNATDPWMADWTRDIGQPLAPKYRVGAGWRRDFTNGTVLVNPSTSSSQTFNLGGTYLLPDGSSAASVTVGPGAGVILQSTSTWAPPSTTTTTPTTTTSTTTTPVASTTTTTTTTSTTTTPTTSTTSTTTSSTTTTTPTNTPSAPPSALKSPAISGPLIVGKTAKTSTGTWSGDPTSFSYRWYRCDAAGANCTAISGATNATYDLVAADENVVLRVTVIASNAAGSAFASSDPTPTIKTTGASK
jgi:Hypothetical glycosyl hydrolase family 15